jgi:hypothetical protein
MRCAGAIVGHTREAAAALNDPGAPPAQLFHLVGGTFHVFDRTGSIEDVPDGYRAMNDRQVLKFQIEP